MGKEEKIFNTIVSLGKDTIQAVNQCSKLDSTHLRQARQDIDGLCLVLEMEIEINSKPLRSNDPKEKAAGLQGWLDCCETIKDVNALLNQGSEWGASLKGRFARLALQGSVASFTMRHLERLIGECKEIPQAEVLGDFAVLSKDVLATALEIDKIDREKGTNKEKSASREMLKSAITQMGEVATLADPGKKSDVDKAVKKAVDSLSAGKPISKECKKAIATLETQMDSMIARVKSHETSVATLGHLPKPQRSSVKRSSAMLY